MIFQNEFSSSEFKIKTLKKSWGDRFVFYIRKKQDKGYVKKSTPQIKVTAIWYDEDGEHEIVRFYDERIQTAEIRQAIFEDLASTSKAAVQSGTISLEFPKRK
ncbi:hypothetical protein [Caldiplasma sukawensis]